MTYTISIVPLKGSLEPGSFQIHVAPSTYSGVVPARHFRNQMELIGALNRLGIPEYTQARILHCLMREITYTVSGAQLGTGVAEEFGWPSS